MKKIIFIMLFVGLIFSQELLNNPESVVFDTISARYLVSNYGDGKIVQIDSLDNQSYFSEELTQLCGLHIYENFLLAVCNLEPLIGLAVFDLTDDSLCYFIDIESEGLLNDITSDTSGNIYISDYYDSKIFKVNLDTRSYALYWDSGFDMPNGIVFDKASNSLICTSNNEPPLFPLRAIDLADSSMYVYVYTRLSSFDGLDFDRDGRLYASTWGSNSVVRFDTLMSIPPETFSTGHDGPADIYFDRYNNLIAVPNFYANTLELISITDSHIEENDIPSTYELACYPNPFNSTLNISGNNHTNISIYNISGELILSEKCNNLYSWTPKKELPSGLYFIRFDSNLEMVKKTVLYIK